MADALKVLYKTTKDGIGRGRHYHIVYINQETQSVMVAPAKGHTHEGKFDERGGIFIGPDDGGTHIHQALESYTPVEKKEDKDDAKTINEVYELLKTGRACEKESIEAAEESEGFYDGSKQWPSGQKEELEGQDRAALTINKIISKDKNISIIFIYKINNYIKIFFYIQIII
jgi:hypothetical protein